MKTNIYTAQTSTQKQVKKELWLKKKPSGCCFIWFEDYVAENGNLNVLWVSWPLICVSPALPTVCNCDLARSGFFQKKGEYICTADYQRLYGTRCDRCDSFITGEVVSALGRTYHPKCFVCSVCRYFMHTVSALGKKHSSILELESFFMIINGMLIILY